MTLNPHLYPKMPLMFGGITIVILGIITFFVWQELPGEFEFIIPGKRGGTSLGYVPSLPVFAAFLFSILGTMIWVAIVLLTRLDVMLRAKKLLPLVTYAITAATIAITVTVSSADDGLRIFFAWVFAVVLSLPVFTSTTIALGDIPFVKKPVAATAEPAEPETKP